MADEKKRIYELSDEALTLASDDYIAVDSSTNGTRKYKPKRLQDQIGDLSTLTTTEKSSLVGAVNEVKGDIPAVDNTLATAGAAADAKKTGDEIAELKGDLNATGGVLGAERTFTGTASTTGADVTFAKMFLKEDHAYTFAVVLPTSYTHNVYFKVFESGTNNRLLQLNFVNGATSGTGIITASADMDVDLKMYISSATETTLSVTVTDQSGISADVEQIAFNISPLSDFGFKFSDYFTFRNGGMSQGGWVSSIPYRVMCDTIMRFDFDITLQIANGFKCGIHTFVNGSFASDSGWRTGTYKIIAGTYFKVVVARYVEITSETANVDLFASMITVVANGTLNTNERISVLTNDLLTGSKTIELPEWEQGSITGSGALATSTTDIRSSYAVHIPAGEYWIDPNGIKTYYFYYTSVGAYSKTCAVDRKWGVTTPFRIKFETDVYLRFVQSISTGMTPQDANLTITKVIPRLPIELKYYRNGISVISKQGEGLGVPPQSLVSIKEAFKNLYDGYRINICKTSDGYYVLSHDRSINSVAKNPDNTDISTTINIDEHTLAELNEYDYGIRYGTQFAGMKITQLDDAVALCAKLGMKVNLEWKFPTMTSDDAESMYDAMVTNGFSNKNWRWIATNTAEIDYFKSVCDYVDIAVLITTASISYYLPTIEYAMSSKHDVVVGYSDGNLTDAQVIQLRKLNVTQNRGTATNISQMIAQIESGVTEIECNFYNPKKALIEYALNN